LTGFYKGDFRQEKGHQQQLWRVCVDGQERSFTGQKPFETAFYFLSYLPEKINQKAKGGDFVEYKQS